jgi:hypothetical protein
MTIVHQQKEGVPPGMLGSIYCMYLEWKNRPFAWQEPPTDYSPHCTCPTKIEPISPHGLYPDWISKYTSPCRLASKEHLA